MNDRTVHAVLCDGTEVVRYNRAGKWKIEPWGDLPDSGAMKLDLLFATMSGTGVRYWYKNAPGGAEFDRRMEQRWDAYRIEKRMFERMEMRGAMAARS